MDPAYNGDTRIYVFATAEGRGVCVGQCRAARFSEARGRARLLVPVRVMHVCRRVLVPVVLRSIVAYCNNIRV